MIKDETLDYLTKLNGGGWSTDEKKERLYSIIEQCAKEFPETPLLSVEIGCFAGVSAFCMANAHKDLNNGFVVTIDSWDNITPTEGTNSEANNDYWRSIDIKAIFNEFLKSKERPEWSGYVKYLHGRSDSFAEKFRDNSITCFHQDGSHNVEAITRELELWSPKIKIGGYWISDDTHWPESKDGYAKLPTFGFELIEDHETWQIWRKTISTSVSLPEGEGLVCYDEEANIFKECRAMQEKNSTTALNLSDIKPISIYLPDSYLPTDKWKDEYENAKTYFDNNGIYNIQWVAGIHAQAWGLTGRHPYLRNYPEAREYMGDAKLGCYLTHYILYCVMDAIDSEAFLVLETDCLFVDGWREKAEQALKDVPDDWDFLYLGSCCAVDKEPVHVKGDVWHFPYRPDKPDFYPQCGHCMLIRKKAVKTLIETQRDPCEPVDIALMFNAFPKLNVYAVLPRLATQRHLDNLAP